MILEVCSQGIQRIINAENADLREFRVQVIEVSIKQNMRDLDKLDLARSLQDYKEKSKN